MSYTYVFNFFMTDRLVYYSDNNKKKPPLAPPHCLCQGQKNCKVVSFPITQKVIVNLQDACFETMEWSHGGYIDF